MAVKILLHICCAPCTIYSLRILRNGGHDVCGLFYNPNIHPYLEYRKRLETLDTYAGHAGMRVIRKEAYPLEEFFRQVAFREEEGAGAVTISVFPRRPGSPEGTDSTPLRLPSSTAAFRSTISSEASVRAWPGRREFPSSTWIFAQAGPRGSGSRRNWGCTVNPIAAASTAKKRDSAPRRGRMIAETTRRGRLTRSATGFSSLGVPSVSLLTQSWVASRLVFIESGISCRR